MDERIFQRPYESWYKDLFAGLKLVVFGMEGYVYGEMFCNFTETDCCVRSDSWLFVTLRFR